MFTFLRLKSSAPELNALENNLSFNGNKPLCVLRGWQQRSLFVGALPRDFLRVDHRLQYVNTRQVYITYCYI